MSAEQTPFKMNLKNVIKNANKTSGFIGRGFPNDIKNFPQRSNLIRRCLNWDRIVHLQLN